MHASLWHSLPFVFADEGGYVERASEPGGAGNLGVSFSVFEQWRVNHGQPHVTFDDLRNLGKPEAGAIYAAMFWNFIHGDELPVGVDYCMFDSAINDGVSGAALIAQAALGLDLSGKVDGSLIAVANKASPGNLVNKLCNECLARKKTKPGWTRFGRGWTARIEKRRKRALEMVKG